MVRGWSWSIPPAFEEGVRGGVENWRPATMTESQRETLAGLAEVWSLAPDVGLGQLMAHLGFMGEVHLEKGLGTIEDDELVAILYRHRAELKALSTDEKNAGLPPAGAALSVSGSSMLPET